MRLRRRKRVYVDDLAEPHDFRFAVVFLLGFVLLLAALYVVGRVTVGDRVPQGSTVDGIDIGGLSRGEARAVLQRRLVPRLQQTLVVRAKGRRYRLDPQETGLVFDFDATVDAAMGGGPWDPQHMLKVVLGGDAVDPVVDVDEAEFRAAMRRIARRTDVPAEDATIRFVGGQPQVADGGDGSVLDLRRARSALARALAHGRTRVTLPYRTVAPAVTLAEATRFVDDVAVPATRRPVTVHVAGTSLEVAPEQFVPALRAERVHGGLRLAFDVPALYLRTQPVLTQLRGHPQNASLTYRGGGIRVVPSHAGRTVAPDEWARAILRAADRSGKHRVARVRTHRAAPPFTTADARRLRIRQVVGSYSAAFGPLADLADMRAVARQLNGILLRPGEEFSFLARAYLSRGDAAESIAAGVTYNAALLAGMTIGERTANPVFGGVLPAGRDAFVRPPRRDLTFTNPSPYGTYVRAGIVTGPNGAPRFMVQLWSTRYVQVRLHTSARTHVVSYRTVRGQSPRCRPQAGQDGFWVTVTRVLTRHGRPAGRTITVSRYSPRPRVVCTPPIR